MKLAFVLFKYFPYGGLQRDFIRIATECLRRGHEVHVYTHTWQGEMTSQLHLHFIHAQGLQNHTRYLRFAFNVRKSLKNTTYDLIIGFNKMPDLDVYYAADDCYQMRIHKERHFLYRVLPRYKTYVEMEKSVFAKGKQTEIMMIAHKQQADFKACYGTEDARFHLLPPGIAKEHILRVNGKEIREMVRKGYEIKQNQFMLLMIGSGFKTKGVNRAIVSLAQLPAALKSRCELVVIGQGNAKPWLKLAKQLNVHNQITFLGARDDITNFLHAADLLLHPAYHENTGTVILEALVAGLPVLTTDTCGYAFYVQEAQAGIVLPSPFIQTDFTHHLEKMLLANKITWQKNALAFTKDADIYSLHERAAQVIEQIGWERSAALS